MAVDGYLNFDTQINTKGFNAGTRQITNSLTGVKSMLGKVGRAAATAFTVRELVSFGKEAVNMASDIQEVQNVVDVSFGHLKGQMEELADFSIQTYGISKLTAKQTGSTYMAMAKGMQIADDAAADMAITLTGLSADMASFYNKDQSVTATALNSIFTGETETLKQFGIVMTEANLQSFAYSQGINKKISAMSQAEKVQLRYNYVMQQTALAQGDFARTQDGWANQTRILSEQWKEFSGTVGTILMNTLLPAVQTLNKALEWLNTTAKNVLESLSAIFDWETESSSGNSVSEEIGNAVDNQNELTDAVEETIEAQKQELMGFDRITKLSDDSASSLNSGSINGNTLGSNTISVDMKMDTSDAETKLTALQQKLKDFVSALKITFNDVFLEWDNLTGEQIAEKIIVALGALAGGVIGFSIGGIPGAIVGTLLGVSLSLVMSSLTFDHDGKLSGEEILSLITMALGAIAGGVIGFGIGGVTGAAVGVTVGASIGFLINQVAFNNDGNLNGEEIVKYAIMALGAIAGGVIGFSLGGGVAGAAVGIAVGTCFTMGITGLSFDNDGQLSADEIVGMIVTAISAIVGGAIGFSVGGPGGAVIGASLGMGLSMFINKIDWEEFGADISAGFSNMLKDIKTWLGNKKSELQKSWENFTSVVSDITATIKAQIATKIEDFKKNWSQFSSLVKSKTAEMKAEIKSDIKTFKNGWSQFSSLVKSKTASMKAEVKGDVKKFKKSWAEFSSLVKGKTAEMKAEVKGSVEDLKKKWKQRTDVVKSKTVSMKAEVSGNLEDFQKEWKKRTDLVKSKTVKFKAGFSEKVEDIRKAAEDRYAAIMDVFSYIPGYFKSTFKSAWDNVKKIFSVSSQTFQDIKAGILDGLKSVLNGLINGINEIIAAPFNGINTALQKIKETSIGGKKPFADKISTISVPAIPKLATGTVVPANYGEFLAVLGDNKRETEVVSPLSTIKQAVSEVVGKGNGNETINITVELDSESVYRKVLKKNKQNTKMTGVNELATA